MVLPCHATQCVRTGDAYSRVARLQTWDSLSQAFRKYGHCDDGAMAGAFSESISTLLSEKWESLPRGADLMNRDVKFKQFVLRHLGEETPQPRWNRIVENASKNCPKHYNSLCKELVKQ
jgi:hypothetical protein